LSNPFYGPSGSPVNQSRGSSAQVRAEFGLIEAGFTAVNTAILGIATSAISAILPSQAGNAGRVLATNGTTVSWADNVPAVAAYASNAGQLGGVAANGYALLSGATFTGPANVLNVAAGNNTTLAANTAFVTAAVAQAKADIVGSSPAALDTLNEFATALANDPNFATTTATSLGNRLRVDTAAQGLNSTQKANAATNLGLAAVATSGLKADVGLGNVDNTSDANKSPSTAQAAINAARVTGVTATAPVVSSGGMAPVISMPAAATGANGYLTAADWNAFSGKQAALGFTPVREGSGIGQSANTIFIGWGSGAGGSGTGGLKATVDSLDLGYLPTSSTNGHTGGTYTFAGKNITAGAFVGNHSGDGSGITGLTAAQINTALTYIAQPALGFTPYNSTNPSGYLPATTAASTYLPLIGGTLTGPLKLPDGSQGAPSLSWSGSSDTDTGFFHLGDGLIGIVCNNVLVGRFTSTGLEVIKITQTAP
jgi:hypothetical protein